MGEQLPQDERADVLMHRGQQYVRIDYLTRLHADVAELRRALTDARNEMACLLAVPSAVVHTDWPCANPADQDCLHSAFSALTNAIKDRP